MTTLLAVYTTSGCVGRCDAKCYEAEGLDCDCICGGVNHGVGIRKAMDISINTMDSIIKNYDLSHLEQEYEFLVNYAELNQLWLPFIDEEE